MKQLLLLRHAEAEAAPPGAKDFDRTLTERGRLEAAEAAAAIAAASITIDEILLSPSRRTRETADVVMHRLGLQTQARIIAPLYLAAADTMLETVRDCRHSSGTVLLIAHNPGISELAHLLSGGAEEVGLRTAGLCLLVFPVDSWENVDAERASSSALLR